MSNTLQAFNRLFNTVIEEFNEDYNVTNRVNQVGDALEKFVKDLYSDSINDPNPIRKYQEVFSYLGSKNHPPDLVLKKGDAIEVKKVQGKIPKDENSQKKRLKKPKSDTKANPLQLNSSAPKQFLLRNDPLIKEECRNCEEDGDLPLEEQWQQKDMLYIIGTVKGKQLCSLWFVYGECYAASAETYSSIKSTITEAIESLGIDLAPTREIARINNVDPLNITDLRVRGMWLIDQPITVFEYLELNTKSPFFAHLIVSKKKFDTFPEEDRIVLDHLIEEHSEVINKKNVKICNPDNPAKNIDAVVVSLFR
ncbi:NgoPII family restriction endonuclease [Acinetobacter sp. WCHAc060025]|uniref:NgoPII family restriction endonuclease n=1 Tax=Acinetobacter sp. WCHAc060025 TaxID=2518625 RepID=UPI0010238C7D|nr:NgoPII family restriction endonuclease [Acinetobacter sp. WCHAc060025]RZG77459.1 NgoPII family restriction endonuclease [Acinetobacter sp. WCHAc060025]